MPASERIDRCVLPVRSIDMERVDVEYDSSLNEGDDSTNARFCSRLFSMLSSCCGDMFINAGTSASFGLFFIVFSSSSSDRLFSMSSRACFTASTSALRTWTS